MSARIEVELVNGSKVLIGGQDDPAGSSLTIPNVTAHTLGIALGSLVDVVEMLEHAVASMANRTEKVEMEFGASISARTRRMPARLIPTPGSTARDREWKRSFATSATG